MPITPCFDPTTGASGGASGGAAAVVTPPSPTSESVASGSALSAKTFGAFTDASGVISSLQAVTTNADGSASWSGSGLGAYTPSSSAGDSGTLSLNAKDSSGNIVATAVHSYDRAAASVGSWVTLKDLNLTDLNTVSAITSGTSTLAFASSGDTISATVTRFSGANGDVTPTNSSGILMNGGTASGTVTLSMDIDALLSSYTRADVSSYVYAVHLVVTSVVYPNAGNSDIFTGLNKGNNTTHNAGEARGYFITDDGGNGDEETRVRSNTSNSSLLSTTTIKTSRVFTYILIGGAIVEVMDTSGTTPPTPLPGGSGTITVGGDAVGLNDTTPIYQGDGLNCYFGAGDKTTATLTRLLVQRFQ